MLQGVSSVVCTDGKEQLLMNGRSVPLARPADKLSMSKPVLEALARGSQ